MQDLVCFACGIYHDAVSCVFADKDIGVGAKRPKSEFLYLYTIIFCDDCPLYPSFFICYLSNKLIFTGTRNHY